MLTHSSTCTLYMSVWGYSWVHLILFCYLYIHTFHLLLPLLQGSFWLSYLLVCYTHVYMHIHVQCTCRTVCQYQPSGTISVTGIQEKLCKFQHFPQDMNLAFLPAFFPHPMATTPIMKPKSAIYICTTCGTFHTSIVCMQETEETLCGARATMIGTL